MSGRQFNAVKWGLLSREVIMPSDDLQKYEELRQGLLSALNPADKLEEILVDEAIASTWRLKRSYRIEAEIFLEKMAAAGEGSFGAAFLEDMEDSGALERLTRYRSAIQKSFFKSIRAIKEMRE